MLGSRFLVIVVHFFMYLHLKKGGKNGFIRLFPHKQSSAEERWVSMLHIDSSTSMEFSFMSIKQKTLLFPMTANVFLSLCLNNLKSTIKNLSDDKFPNLSPFSG